LRPRQRLRDLELNFLFNLREHLKLPQDKAL